MFEDCDMGIGKHLTNDASLTFPKTEILDYRAVKSFKFTQVWIIYDTGGLHVKMSTEVGCNSCGSVQTETVQHVG